MIRIVNPQHIEIDDGDIQALLDMALAAKLYLDKYGIPSWTEDRKRRAIALSDKIRDWHIVFRDEVDE